MEGLGRTGEDQPTPWSRAQHPSHLILTDLASCAGELAAAAPLTLQLNQELPGRDASVYMLATLAEPLKLRHDGEEREIKHLLLEPHSEGRRVGAEPLAQVGIWYVLDRELPLSEDLVDLGKCAYAGVGMAQPHTDPYQGLGGLLLWVGLALLLFIGMWWAGC